MDDKLVVDPAFQRAFKSLVRKNPQLDKKVDKCLNRLRVAPFSPSLGTHKLKGNLAGSWSCSVDYAYRIIFKFKKNPDSSEDEILLIDIGKHDQVY
ncbi:addiction module toxin, RelE/StbE family (plasmid) [Thalassoporum mexicanum PCC 7367]|uniref:type II toxin-antitoxin system RelE/ParE family toxin n=1 Tax=Thalassoporum mexicanum TaxID=3457544 RepID=UPI00029FAE0D|nr:type II toxin-antitoxin system mRNA interferase toxin, RelE/StbE family [Pseudanabaena sp. PCC 7367]AFY72086.1 addiction module toxin, RelE/StbE family [Pseudanabaena sp. PCC 7367]